MLEEPVSALIALGGGSRSRIWCQIIADVMQRPVDVVRHAESTCLGAGMLAAAATGLHGSIREAAAEMSGTSARFEPDAANALVYDRLFDVYRRIYPALRDLFPSLAAASAP